MTVADAEPGNRWIDADHARAYLANRDSIPFRAEGIAVLAEFVPAEVGRVLDLGTGDGILMGLIRDLRPGARGLACDFSDEMLGRASARFDADPSVEVVRHDLDEPLPVGTVITNEPGLYYPDDPRGGWGVRVEDDYWCNPETGRFELLTSFDRSLVI